MPTVKTRAGTLAYTDRGEGPTLVLLHATLHDHHDFDAIAPQLQRHYRVIAVDWPGCGASPPMAHPGRLGAAQLADALEDIVDHLDASPVMVIGNSVGGFAAARLALNRPHVVAGLVLVDSGGFVPMTPMTRLFCRLMGTPWLARLVLPGFARIYLRPQTTLDRQILDRVVIRAKSPAGVQHGAAMWRSFATPAHDLRSRAADVRTPTLIVWGRYDRAIPLSVGRATHAVLRNSTLAVLSSGHVPFASVPEDFLRVALPFLEEAANRANPNRTSNPSSQPSQ